MNTHIAQKVRKIMIDAGVHLSSFDEARLRNLERRFGSGGSVNDVKSLIESDFGGKIALAKNNLWRDIDLFLKRYYK